MIQQISKSTALPVLAAALFMTAALAGCSSAYYSTWEMFGK